MSSLLKALVPNNSSSNKATTTITSSSPSLAATNANNNGNNKINNISAPRNTTTNNTTTTSNITLPTIDPTLVQFYKYICDYQQVMTHKEEFDKEIQQLQERLNRGLVILKETFKDKEFKKEFKNYWMNENSEHTRQVLIDKICNHIYNSIESLVYQSFEYDKIDSILFNSLCKDLNIVHLISKKEYCIRKDEEIISEHLNFLKLKFNRETIKATCLFKKLVQYFVMNGIIILYKSIKQAQF